jgi:hypothetical protein
MPEDEDEVEESSDLPLDESLYVSEDEDTMERAKETISKLGTGVKRGAEEFVTGSKDIASKAKGALSSAYERNKAKREAAKVKREAAKAKRAAEREEREAERAAEREERAAAIREEEAEVARLESLRTAPVESLTVRQLKERLRELGLAISGKKDELVERIQEFYRTDIPTQEDGAPELIDDLKPVSDVPSAPDLDLLSSTEEEIDDEQSADPEVVDETPIHQFTEGEQLYVYDPSRNVKSKSDWKANKVNSTISMFFGILMFLFTMSIMDYGFSMGLFEGPMSILNWLAAERIVRPYGGMDDLQQVTLAAILAMFFFCSSLLYISGKRQVAAALMAMVALLFSFSFRIYTALSVDAFEDVNVIGLLLIDLVASIPFAFTCWVPAMTSSVLFSNDAVRTDFFVAQSEHGVSAEPEPITDSSDEDYAGEDMSAFSVSRPIPPKRRQPKSYSGYEMLFLLLSLALWPASLTMLILFSLPDFSTRYGAISVNSTEGTVLLGLFFFLSALCSYIVYRYDSESRAGDVYAKEKLAYHRDMDQYLDLKKVYYEKKAEDLGSSSPTDEES